jgi:hypothetical protein
VDKHVEKRLLTARFAFNGALCNKLPNSLARIRLNKINDLAALRACHFAMHKASGKYFDKTSAAE